MNELIQKFIGKECLIYCINSETSVEGVIQELKDGWITVVKEDSEEIINTEYIVRIREYPRNKKGKKKSVVLD
ncbi:MAG: hypothetical protein MRZ61_00440 [Oscillospiraceae bacterium]|nr:hypothetical protein [Oscillospiraceae bacterium]